ncbi:MAG: NADH-quinone oxidoreductase subunit NuoH [Bacteroidia bacterium]|nr:NADH-quinone oxidoreductase subunit NuoH [Bacteroidia bacterium]
MWTFGGITSAIDRHLSDAMGPLGAQITELAIAGVVLLGGGILMSFTLGYMERKVAAFMQMRLGPNRVGFRGSLQIIADTLKLLFKESFAPGMSDKFLFNLAPFIMVVATMLSFAPIPFDPALQIFDINIGVFFVSSVTSLSVIGILIAGWSSNNKYSLMGAMRSGAQIVSYELSAGISLVTIVAFSGTMSFSGIVASQADAWWIFKGHLPVWIAFVIFIIAGTAELNRAPFDLAEAESELTGGFHTEYPGMRFAMFLLSEYLNMFVLAGIGATLFLGGWMPLHLWDLHGFNQIMDYIPPVVWFFMKTFFIIFVIMWFRWTFPRLRIDQLLTLEWKYLMPISLVNLIIVALVVILGLHF